MRIQRFRFCNQVWNWSRSSPLGSGGRGGRVELPGGGALKNSSYDTPPGAALPAVGTAGRVGVASSPNTELSESVSWAGRVGAPLGSGEASLRSASIFAAGLPATRGGLEASIARKKSRAERPPVASAAYWRCGSGAGLGRSRSAMRSWIRESPPILSSRSW